MKKLHIKKTRHQPESIAITVRPVVLANSELRRRETALADFLKVNGNTIRVVDEVDGIFAPADAFDVYLVTLDKIKGLKFVGEQYGYRIYEVESA
jgi:hypothetical protein